MEPKGDEEWAQKGSPCCTFLSLGTFSGPNKTKLSFEWHKSQYLARPGATRRISRRKTGPVSLVEGVHQIHGQDAPLIVVVVFLEPTSDDVGDGFTAVLGSEPPRGVPGNSGQQGSRCETSLGWPSASVCLNRHLSPNLHSDSDL